MVLRPLHWIWPRLTRCTCGGMTHAHSWTKDRRQGRRCLTCGQIYVVVAVHAEIEQDGVGRIIAVGSP